jgi:hypothetical protein
MKMIDRIASCILVGLVAFAFAAGCASHVERESPQSKTPDVQGAIKFITDTYKVPVRQVDDKTLDVTWESGAEKLFQDLKTRLKTDYGVDLVTTTIE